MGGTQYLTKAPPSAPNPFETTVLGRLDTFKDLPRLEIFSPFLKEPQSILSAFSLIGTFLVFQVFFNFKLVEFPWQELSLRDPSFGGLFLQLPRTFPPHYHPPTPTSSQKLIQSH